MTNNRSRAAGNRRRRARSGATRSSTVIWLAGLIVVVAFAAGIVRVFSLRFEAGDIYPAYSSLRADPIGTKILYEAIDSCEGLSATRKFTSVDEMRDGSVFTLFYLGSSQLDSQYVYSETAASLNSFVRRGGRVVMTFLPRNWMLAPEGEDETGEEGEPAEDPAEDEMDGDEEKEEKEEEEEEEEEEDEEDEREKDYVLLDEWWGLALADEPVTALSAATVGTNYLDSGLPQSISCHTSMFFTDLDPSWRVVYSRLDMAVIIERSIGRGTIVLSAPTFFVSNEAMRDERHPGLLAWLAGPHERVVFDEYRHGLAETVGIATLARRYRLHWLGAGLVCLAGLFFWQNGIGLVPASSPGARTGRGVIARGKGSASGLVNLLRRNVASADILHTCIDEWRKSAARTGPNADADLARAREIADRERNLPPGKRIIAKAYKEISGLLDKTRRQGSQ